MVNWFVRHVSAVHCRRDLCVRVRTSIGTSATAVCQGVVIDALVLKQDREICDGKDNDCDGRIDEGLTRRCGSNVGECRMGEQTCENGEWLECRREVRPVDEVCDQLDNDCDGRTDERDGDDGALDGSVCVEDPPSCDECDNTWAPVCGDDPSLIYTNRCEATCAGIVWMRSFGR